MGKKKINYDYNFSVEGETEKLYFDWLQDLINNLPDAKRTVTIKSKVEQNPLKHSKSKLSLTTKKITHICDYEENTKEYDAKFENILRQLKDAKCNKKIKYELAYSNFTFDLWIILHKIDCYGSLSNRKNYLSFINKAFNEKFVSLDEYKEERNFNRCLSKLSIDDVINAIERAEFIQNNNVANHKKIYQYCGFKYYKDNPALNVYISVKEILKDCKFI